MNRKYNVNDNYFDVIDNQNKAYILGFLYADGCNYKNGYFKIDLQEEDKNMLEVFKKELNFEGNATRLDHLEVPTTPRHLSPPRRKLSTMTPLQAAQTFARIY